MLSTAVAADADVVVVAETTADKQQSSSALMHCYFRSGAKQCQGRERGSQSKAKLEEKASEDRGEGKGMNCRN